MEDVVVKVLKYVEAQDNDLLTQSHGDVVAVVAAAANDDDDDDGDDA